MKIKVNNIFKNIQSNKEKINIQRRRNLDRINQLYEEVNDVNESTEPNLENIEYRRKGAQKCITKFNVLNIFKKQFAIKRSYYVLFILMIILAGISVYTNIATYKGLNNESFAVFGNNDDTDEKEQEQSSVSEDLQDIASNNSDTRASTNNQSTSTKSNVTTNTSTSTNVKKTTTPTVVTLSFVKPLDGEVIKVYSTDKLLYSKTLESWKTHDGIDINASLGQNVKSIEKGIVERVYDDSFLGTTVIIDHGQGYKSIYSNLENSVSVKEKQTIKKLAIIGKVGKTSIGEVKDESHIHFMLMLNNKVIDPTSKIKF